MQRHRFLHKAVFIKIYKKIKNCGINSQEIGDGSPECPTSEQMNEMVDTFIGDKQLYCHIVERINELKATGYYGGGYECVKLAAKKQ